MSYAQTLPPIADAATGRIAKRAFDLAVSSISLLALSPILLAAAVAVKTTSKGPILFRQARYGRDGVPFQCLKFRTMTVCEKDDEFVQAVRGDARVTRIGAFLRRTSIDELPQIANVLAGSMSIVGPRPHPLALDDRYRHLIPGYDRRFAERPGMTGLSQIRGHRGPTPTVESMAARVAADVEYVDTRSIAMDLSIVLRTVPALLRDVAF